MMRIFLAFCAFLVLGSCNRPMRMEVLDDAGQLAEVYFLDKDSLRTGVEKSFYPTGELYSEAHYDKGLLDGERLFYYPSGNIQSKEIIRKGSFEGPYTTYYESGAIEQQGQYVQSVMTGTWTFYYESGQVKETVTMSDNKENGPFTEYHPNGKIKAKGTYRDGDNEHGLLEIYDDSGTLTRKMDCDMGACRTIWQKG